MDLGGIFKKIEDNADVLGGILGGLGAIKSHAWGQDIPTGIQITLEGLMRDPHIPDISHAWQAFSQFPNSVFKPALLATIGGYILETIDLDPRLERLGSALKKAGMGAMMGGFATQLLIYSGAGHSDGADHGLGGGSHVSFLSGSRHNPHGAYTEPSVAPYGTNLTRSAASSPGPYQ